MNLWHDLNFGDIDSINTVIEIPKLSRVKYELDKDSGTIKVDRVLYSPMHYPANYGFIPKTLWGDGDPIDILVLSHEEFFPGCLIESRPIGKLDMVDGGEDDVKILAVPASDPRFKNINDISDIEPHTLEEIQHFFKTYKDLQQKEVSVGEWSGKQAAVEAIKTSIEMYEKKYGKAVNA